MKAHKSGCCSTYLNVLALRNYITTASGVQETSNSTARVKQIQIKSTMPEALGSVVTTGEPTTVGIVMFRDS